MTSKRLEIARGKHVLKSVFDGYDFDVVFHDPVVYPPAAVLAENLPVLRAFHAREGLHAAGSISAVSVTSLAKATAYSG